MCHNHEPIFPFLPATAIKFEKPVPVLHNYRSLHLLGGIITERHRWAVVAPAEIGFDSANGCLCSSISTFHFAQRVYSLG
jgi:hypothetical protein